MIPPIPDLLICRGLRPNKTCRVDCCIQDTLSSRAALGLPSASRKQRYLAYKIDCYTLFALLRTRSMRSGLPPAGL